MLFCLLTTEAPVVVNTASGCFTCRCSISAEAATCVIACPPSPPIESPPVAPGAPVPPLPLPPSVVAHAGDVVPPCRHEVAPSALLLRPKLFPPAAPAAPAPPSHSTSTAPATHPIPPAPPVHPCTACATVTECKGCTAVTA